MGNLRILIVAPNLHPPPSYSSLAEEDNMQRLVYCEESYNEYTAGEKVNKFNRFQNIPGIITDNYI